MNETLMLIQNRSSCREFAARDVDEVHLKAIAHAAIQSPSGMNRQHWQIIVIKNKELIDQMDKEGMHVLSLMEDNSMYDRMMARGGRLFYNAPCMILISIKEASPRGAELIDLGIVAQNVVLAATSLGISSLHCGLVNLSFVGERADEFKARLKFNDGFECGMAVLLGYSKTATLPHEPDFSKITIVD